MNICKKPAFTFGLSAALSLCLSLFLPLSILAADLAESKGVQTEQKSAEGEKKPEPEKEAFDFEYYASMMEPLETKHKERLCGLDKVCVELWRKGKLQIYKDGRLFLHDFNSDGKMDEAVILEQDVEDEALEKEFLIYISTIDDSGKRKLLYHELLPDAQNVIDVFLDKAKNSLAIDTGGRIIRTQTFHSFGYDGGYYQTGQTYKVVIIVRWNPDKQSFELFIPSKAEPPPKKKQKKSK